MNEQPPIKLDYAPPTAPSMVWLHTLLNVLSVTVFVCGLMGWLLIGFGSVATVTLTGPVVAGLSTIMIFLASVAMQYRIVWLGLWHVSFCVLMFGVIWWNNWDMEKLDAVLTSTGFSYVIISLVATVYSMKRGQAEPHA